MNNHLTPKVREALLLAYDAPRGELVRCPGGFGRKGDLKAGVVTSRTANTLQASSLVDFDQPLFPTAISLTRKGVELADELAKAQAAKAGAA